MLASEGDGQRGSCTDRGAIVNIVAIALPIVFSLLSLGVLFLVAWYGQRRTPRSWTHVGAPPPGADKALRVLHDLCPGMAWGGTIEWVDGPALDGASRTNIGTSGGEVLDFDAHRIRLLRHPDVWETAIAHEMHHLWRYSTTGKRDELENEAFRRWVNDANSMIATETQVAST
jgi:hypothetical protein